MASTAPLELLPSWRRPDAVPCSVGIRLAARAWREFERSAELARWDALSQWASEPNPFHESWFLLPALRAFDPDERVTLLCLEADGQLAGLLPIAREPRYYGRPLPHWSNWLHANAFLGLPLVAPGFEAAFWRELLAWCDAQRGGGLFLHLAQMPTQGPLHDALVRTLADTRREAATVLRAERAMLRSELSPEAYLEQSVAMKRRKELRRKHRRLEEMGELRIERATGEEQVEAWIEDFLALERAGWKGTAGSALACDAATTGLFVESVRGAARRGRLERLAMRLDGRPVAMLASFHCPPGAFGFKTAFDESFARFSPGVLLQCEYLAVLNNRAIEWTDSCAAADHPMIDHFWRERRAIAHHNIAVGGTVRRQLFRAVTVLETGASPKGIE